MTAQIGTWDWEDWESFNREMYRPWITPDELALGPPPVMEMYDVRDDEDYGEPTRRMIVLAPSAEAAEAMWDDPFTEDNVYAHPMRLKGRVMSAPGPARVLYTQWLIPVSSSEAA